MSESDPSGRVNTAVVLAEVRDKFVASGDDIARVSGPDLDAYCGQVARARDAASRIEAEGLVIADEKGRPVPHPALDIERRAQAEIRAWGDRFRPRSRKRPAS